MDRADHILDAGYAGHSAGEGVALSPDGRLVAMAGVNGVIVWGSERGELLHRLAPANFQGFCVPFSPDGKRLAACGLHGKPQMRVWETTTGNETAGGRELPFLAKRIAFTHDGRGLIAVPAQLGPTGIVRWEVETGKELAAVPGTEKARGCVAVSRDGKWLAAAVPPRDNPASSGAEPRIWDLATGKPLSPLQGAPRLWPGYHVDFAFSPDGRSIAIPQDNLVRVWDVETGAPRHILRGHTGQVMSVAFSADTGLLASGSLDRTVRVWDLTTGQERHRFRPFWQPIAVALSPDGLRLAANVAGKVELWCLDQLEQAASLGPPSARRESSGISFANDDQLLVTHRAEAPCELWDASNRKQTRGRNLFSRDDLPMRVIPSPDGKRLAAHFFKELVVLEAETGKRLLVLPNEGENRGRPKRAAFSADGSLLVTCGADGRVQVWEVDTGKTLHRFDLKPGLRAEAVFFDPRGRFVTIALGGSAEFLIIWERFANTRDLKEVVRANQMAVSPDGRSLVVGGVGQFWVLNTATWDISRHRLVGSNSLTSLAFSHDGKRLFTGHDDGQMWIWDTTTWEQLVALPVAAGAPVDQIAVSPAGRWLATLAASAVKLWDSGPEQ